MERPAPKQDEILLVFENIDNAQLFVYWKEAYWDFTHTEEGNEMYGTLEGIHNLLTTEMIDRGLTEYMVGERDKDGKAKVY